MSAAETQNEGVIQSAGLLGVVRAFLGALIGAGAGLALWMFIALWSQRALGAPMVLLGCAAGAGASVMTLRMRRRGAIVAATCLVTLVMLYSGANLGAAAALTGMNANGFFQSFQALSSVREHHLLAQEISSLDYVFAAISLFLSGALTWFPWNEKLGVSGANPAPLLVTARLLRRDAAKAPASTETSAAVTSSRRRPRGARVMRIESRLSIAQGKAAEETAMEEAKPSKTERRATPKKAIEKANISEKKETASRKPSVARKVAPKTSRPKPETEKTPPSTKPAAKPKAASRDKKIAESAPKKTPRARKGDAS